MAGVLWDGKPFCGGGGWGGGVILWDRGAPRGSGNGGGLEVGVGGCGYYGMAGPFAARASGVLWGGTIPSACARAAIMGWRCTYCLTAKYYGMRRAGGGECYYGMPAQHGAGRGAAAPAAVQGTQGSQGTPGSRRPPSRPTAGPLAPSSAPQQFPARSAGGVLWDGRSPRAGVRAWGGGCHGAFPVGGYYGMDLPLWTIMGCVRCRRVGLPRRAAGGARRCPARTDPGRERGHRIGAAVWQPACRGALYLLQLGRVRRRRQPCTVMERRAK